MHAIPASDKTCRKSSGVWACLLFLSCFVCFPAGESHCQTLYADISVGGSNYQGELKDRHITTHGMRLAFGAGVTYASDDRFAVSLSYIRGMLGGSDSHNASYFTRRRNLHFDTELQELSITGRINLTVSRETAFVPYLMAGLAAFRVDPFTTDELGKRHPLFPLSTEGQGLPQYPDNPAHRYMNLSLPMGGGVEVRLTRGLRMDLELAFRKTFTDHIDDVSGSYPDENLLLSHGGFKAVELSYRADELPGGDPIYPVEGTGRGNPKTKDWYYFLKVVFRYPIFTRAYRYDRINYIIKGADWPYRF